MTTITQITDLSAGSPSFAGWETYAAGAFDVILYTANKFAAYSVNLGATFAAIDFDRLCAHWGENLCCDQVVIFAPPLGRFVWLMQTDAGNYILGFATPEEIKTFSATRWDTVYLKANDFRENGKFDRPALGAGDGYLYIAANFDSQSVGIRIAWSDLKALFDGQQSGVPVGYFTASESFWMKTVRNTGDTGYFIAEKDRGAIHLYTWPENSDQATMATFSLSTIPISNYTVLTPSGGAWLDPGSKIDTQVESATRSGDEIWAAWSGARRVENTSVVSFAYPHIGIAIININTTTLSQR